MLPRKLLQNDNFLTDQFVPRKVTGNLSQDNSQASSTCHEPNRDELSGVTNNDSEQSQTEIETNLELEHEVIATSSTSNKRSLPIQDNSNPIRKRKYLREATMQKLLNIEEQKLAQFKQGFQQNDGDYFAQSLVPYIKELLTHRQLFIRTKFQELLIQEHEKLRRTQCIPQPVVISIFQISTPTSTP